jgi:hypothetical protein
MKSNLMYKEVIRTTVLNREVEITSCCLIFNKKGELPMILNVEKVFMTRIEYYGILRASI